MALISFINPASKYYYVNIAWLVLLILFPIILWMLPATFFDGGTSICPSKILFDVECLGCGITRAVMHLHHLDWQEAIYHNYLVVLVYPALVFVWFYWIKKAVKRNKIHLEKRKQIGINPNQS